MSVPTLIARACLARPPIPSRSMATPMRAVHWGRRCRGLMPQAQHQQRTHGRGDEQRDEQAEHHVHRDQQAVDRRHAQAECDLPARCQRRGRRVGNHVPREQDEGRTGHRQQGHGPGDTEAPGPHRTLADEAGDRGRTQRQVAGGWRPVAGGQIQCQPAGQVGALKRGQRNEEALVVEGIALDQRGFNRVQAIGVVVTAQVARHRQALQGAGGGNTAAHAGPAAKVAAACVPAQTRTTRPARQRANA